MKIRLIKFARCNYNRRPANLRLTKLQFLLNKHNPIELLKSYPSYPDLKTLDYPIRNNDHLTLNLGYFRFEKSKKVGIDFYQNSKWRVGSLIGDPSIFRQWLFEVTDKYGRKSNNLDILKGAFQFKTHWFETVNMHIAHVTLYILAVNILLQGTMVLSLKSLKFSDKTDVSDGYIHLYWR